MVVANLTVAFGSLADFGAMVYVAGLAWFLLVSAVQVGLLVLGHTRAR